MSIHAEDQYREEKAVTKSIHTPQPGEMLQVGNWPFSEKEDIRPVEWIVLSIEENETALLLTKHCIDFQPCDRINNNYSNRMIWNENDRPPYSYCWHRSYLFSWLKNMFYNKCFNDEEKKQIVDQEIIIKKDKKICTPVNLLSAIQALSLLPRPYDRQATATPYSIESQANNQPIAWWLTDTTGFFTDAAAVYADGSVCVKSSDEYIWTDFQTKKQKNSPICHGITVNSRLGVRPAIRIKLYE